MVRASEETRNRGTRRAFALACCFAFFLSLALPVLALGKTVHVYSGEGGTAYDHIGQGYILQQMGMLGSNGEPPTPDDQGRLWADHDGDGTAEEVGRILKNDEGDFIGYAKKGDGEFAYSLDATSLAGVWSTLSDGDALHILVHGRPDGGYVYLDDRTAYPGFAAPGEDGGTGYPCAEDPYELPRLPAGAEVTVSVNACGSAATKQPGDWLWPNPKGSVTESVEGHPDVTAATGHPGWVDAVSDVDTTDSGWANIKEWMRNNTATVGLSDGDAWTEGDDELFKRWLGSLPFEDQYRTLVEAAGGESVKVTYDKQERQPEGGNPPEDEESRFWAPPEYFHREHGGQIRLLGARLEVFPGSLGSDTVFTIVPLPYVPGTPPGRLASGVFDFWPDGTSFDLNLPARLTLEYPAGMDPQRLNLFYLDAAEAWRAALAGRTVDPTNHTITVSVAHLSTYALFESSVSTPASSSWTIALTVVGGLLAAFVGTRYR